TSDSSVRRPVVRPAAGKDVRVKRIIHFDGENVCGVKSQGRRGVKSERRIPTPGMLAEQLAVEPNLRGVEHGLKLNSHPLPGPMRWGFEFRPVPPHAHVIRG